MKLDFTHINDTPVFKIPSSSRNLERVFGGKYNKKERNWYFPAFLPFATTVLDDLQQVCTTLDLTPQAQTAVQNLDFIKGLKNAQHLPEDDPGFVYPPYQHQLEGLTSALYNYRLALFWDPGTGKTKVMVDLLRRLHNQRAVVLCPLVATGTWAEQVAEHGDGALTSKIIGSAAQFRKFMASDEERPDVLITTYGLARTVGVPGLSSKAKKLVELPEYNFAWRHLAATRKRWIEYVGDAKAQVQFLTDLFKGRKWEDVLEEIKENYPGPRWLIEYDYTTLIADESHCIKRIQSNQTKAVLKLSKKAVRRYLLTGTPTTGDPRHLYPQLQFLGPGLVAEGWMAYQKAFLNFSKWNKHVVTGYKNLHVLNERVNRIAIWKKKDECLDLPDRVIQDIHVTLSGDQKKLYNDVIASVNGAPLDLRGLLSPHTKDATAPEDLSVRSVAVLLGKLCQIVGGFIMPSVDTKLCDTCPHLLDCTKAEIMPYTKNCQKTGEVLATKRTKQQAKADVLDQLVDDILAGSEDNKVIIWAKYVEELRIIEEILQKKQIGYVMVSGKVPQVKRDEHRNTFNTDPDCRVYVGQVATGIAITLNAANYTIYYSLDWALANYLQSIDRNYRAGQTRKVTVYRIIAQGTVDEYIAQALAKNQDIATAMTKKVTCMLCEYNIDCILAGTKPFEEGCIHPRKASRVIAKAKTLK